MSLIEITLIIVLVVSIIFNIFLLRRAFGYMDTISVLSEELEEQRIFYYRKLESLLSDMKQIDSSGAFESDDEVGSIFEELKNTIEQYNTENE